MNRTVRETEKGYSVICPIAALSPVSYVIEDENGISAFRRIYKATFLVIVVLLGIWYKNYTGTNEPLKWPSFLVITIGGNLFLYGWIILRLKARIVYNEDVHGKFKDRIFI